MRIIRLKLSKHVQAFILTICQKLKSGDVSFVEDLYALLRLRGNCIPDDGRCQKLAEFYATATKAPVDIARILIRKRRALLKSIIATSVFSHWLKNGCSKNALEFLEDLLFSFRRISHKLRQSECCTCMYRPDCEFGKQYADTVFTITTVLDPDFKKKAHPNCPVLPNIELSNDISRSVAFMRAFADPHTAAAAKNAIRKPHYIGAGSLSGVSPEDIEEAINAAAQAEENSTEMENDSMLEYLDPDEFPDELNDRTLGLAFPGMSALFRFDTTHFVGGTNIKPNLKVINDLNSAELGLYQLALKLDSLLGASKKGHFKPVEKPTQQRKVTRIKTVSDVTKVVTSQQALPNHIFDIKLAKKELDKTQQQEPEKKKQLLYLLIDTSDSMNTSVGNLTFFGYVSRAALAVCFALALARRVRDDGGYMFFRTFSGGPSPLTACRVRTDFDRFSEHIAECQFDGMSTRIANAIEAAALDIETAKGELAKSEILIITDAEDTVPDNVTAGLRSLLGDTPLHVLEVCNAQGNAKVSLQALADNYYQFDPNQPSLEKMVNLIGGKKKTGKRSYV